MIKVKEGKKLPRGRPKTSTIKARQSQRDYQFKICVWLALGKSNRQIIDLLQDRVGMRMSRQVLDKTYRYGKKWKPVISYLRIRYLNNISRIPIVNQVKRLSMLNEAAEEALTYHTKTVNQFGTVLEKKIGNIPALCKEVRETLGESREAGRVIEKHTHYTSIDISTDGKSTKELIDVVLGRSNGKSLAGTRK